MRHICINVRNVLFIESLIRLATKLRQSESKLASEEKARAAAKERIVDIAEQLLEKVIYQLFQYLSHVLLTLAFRIVRKSFLPLK